MNSPCPAVSRDDEVCDVESSNDGTSDKESKKPKPRKSFEQIKKDPGMMFSTSFEDYLSYLRLCHELDVMKQEMRKTKY